MRPEVPTSERISRLPGALVRTAEYLLACLPILIGPGRDSVTGPDR